jgi:hypothetical protein
MIGDIFFKNSDLAGADQLAERFKKMLPPNLQDDEDGQPIPPQAKAAIAQSQMQLQALNEYAKQIEGEKKQLEFEKQAKVVDNQFKLEVTKLTRKQLRYCGNKRQSAERARARQAGIRPQRQIARIRSRSSAASRFTGSRSRNPGYPASA